MQSSQQWIDYFKANLQVKRINWQQDPAISAAALKTIVKSLQAWQLGETSDGKNLIRASEKYALHEGDPGYVDAVQLFIKEEQKHGNNLGMYLDLIGQPRVKKDWGDTLFRRVRYFNTSMEMWTLAVITVESTAQLFYQCLKDATGCPLLKEICTDILIDEEAHIHFQMQRLAAIYAKRNGIGKWIAIYGYKYFFFCTAFVVWAAHHKVFKAGNKGLHAYYKSMRFKFCRTIGTLIPRSNPMNRYPSETLFIPNHKKRYEN